MSEPPYPPPDGQDDGQRQETWPFPQYPAYGQPPDQPWGGRPPPPGYGQPGYGPPGYGPPGYPPAYGQQGYGPPPYAPQGYGRPPYGPPPWGPPPWGQPPAGPPPPKNKRNTVIALLVAAVVVVAGVGVALWLTVGRNGTSTAASGAALPTASSAVPTTPGGSGGAASPSNTANAGGASTAGIPPTTAGIPPATQQPTGLGDDPVENQYAQECFDGDMASCDALYIISDQGTPYSRYADTCAGRQPEGTQRLCEDTFPG